MMDGTRQVNGRGKLEKLVKGVGFMPVCHICDSVMEQQERHTVDTYYQCPLCGQKWVDELTH